jgi:hypothetical protein
MHSYYIFKGEETSYFDRNCCPRKEPVIRIAGFHAGFIEKIRQTDAAWLFCSGF